MSIPPAHAQRDRPHVPTNQCQPTQHDRRQARTNIAHPPASARRCRKLCCSVRMFAATCLLRSQDGSEGWLKVTPSASECAAAATFSLSCKHDHSSERQSACACSPAITPPTASTRQRAFATHTASHYGQHARDRGTRKLLEFQLPVTNNAHQHHSAAVDSRSSFVIHNATIVIQNVLSHCRS